jgi:hypothetical protein
MNSSKKVILFLSYGNQYLEHNLYCTLAKKIPKDYHKVYLYSDYDNGITASNLEEKNNCFNQIIDLPCPKFKSSLRSLTGIFLWIRHLKQLNVWKKQILKKVDELSPSTTILLSAFMINSALILKERPDIQMVFLQSCNTKRSYTKKQLSLRGGLKRIFYNKIVGVPRKSNQNNPWLVEGINYFLVWSRKWVQGIGEEEIKRKYKFTGFPMNDEDYRNFVADRVVSSNASILILLNKETSIGLSNWKKYTDFYLEFIQRNPQFNIKIKPHPLSDKKLITTSFSKELIVDSFDWNNIDLMINHWSTASITSIVRGVPTILINPAGEFNFKERFLDHYKAIATNIAELEVFIQNFSKSPEDFKNYREDFLLESFTSLEPNSTSNVVKLILEISK